MSQGEIGSWKQQFSAHAQPVHKHNITQTPHAGWCYQTTPLGSNAQSKYSNNWDMRRTISNFESQRIPRLSSSRLTDRHLAQCTTLSLIASEAGSPLWVFNVSKYCRQSCSSVCDFPPCQSIQYSTFVLWQWQVFRCFWSHPLISAVQGSLTEVMLGV